MTHQIEVNAEFPPKLECLFQPKRFKVLYGGRGGTKSWGVARALLVKAGQSKLRVLCVREFQSSIEESVHKLLSDQIELLQIGHLFTTAQRREHFRLSHVQTEISSDNHSSRTFR